MGSLSITIGRDELSETYGWLSQCGDRRISKDVQAKCRLFKELTDLGVSRSSSPRLVEQASELTNFVSLNSKLLGFVIWLETNGISLDPITNNITYTTEEGEVSNRPNFFESEEYFGSSSQIFIAGYNRKKKNLNDFKISTYRYMRIWAIKY